MQAVENYEGLDGEGLGVVKAAELAGMIMAY